MLRLLRSSPRHLRIPVPSPLYRRPSRGRIIGVSVLVMCLVSVTLPLTRAVALRQSQAVWSVKCDVSHRAPDDPIVFPAQAGRSHMHDFFGNVSTDADSSTASLVKAGSSCLEGIDAVDRAAYWTPSLLNGDAVVTAVPGEQRIDAYYAVLDKRMPVRPIPFGLRMIAGNAKATSPQPLDVAHFNCLRHPNGGQVTRPSASIPTCPGGSYLSAKISFPGCWDGKNLDSPDHKSHMAYPVRGACPVSHPVGLPSVGIRVRWKTVRGVPSSRLSLSSGGQLSLHADFWNVWNPAAMQWLVTNCLNQSRNCTDIARSQIAATGSFPSGDGQLSAASGANGGASTATRPASTPATARPRGQVAAANDSVAADGGTTPQPGNDNDGDLLAVTGPSDTRLPLGAGLLLAVGIAIVAVARYRPRHTRR
jgi:Domain of unknown function (DUF1996)